MVAGTSPRARASPAWAIAIMPGRRRNASLSTTTILALCSGQVSADGRIRGSRWDGRGRARLSAPVSSAVSSHHSASRRWSSTPSTSPLSSNKWAYTTLRTGLARTTSLGIDLSQPSNAASCRRRLMAGAASSTRPAARSKSPPASAWWIASAGEPCCSYHSLARRCSVGTWSGCSALRCVASTSAKRW